MATYFINPNGNENFPYKTPDDGAVNFNNLLSNVNLLFGDEIKLVPIGIIDDSDEEVIINANVKIKSNHSTKPKVLLHNGLGLSLLKDGIQIENIEFFDDGSTNSQPLININGVNDIKIKNCKFYTNTVVDPKSLIKIIDSSFVTIENCEFRQLTSDPNYATINIEDSSKVDIKGNKIQLDGDNNLGIFVTGNNPFSDINIYDNLIYHPNFQDQLISGIHFDGKYDNVNVYRNVIRYSDINESFGIKIELNNYDGRNIKIKNNTLIREFFEYLW